MSKQRRKATHSTKKNDLLKNISEFSIDNPKRSEIEQLTHAFNLSLAGYWTEKFERLSLPICLKFYNVFVIKDGVNSSSILAHLHYYEQANTLLRVNYEKLLLTLSQMIDKYHNLTDDNHIGTKNKRGEFSPKKALETLSEKIFKNNGVFHFDDERYYKLYKDLCQPTHDPQQSMSNSDPWELPFYSEFDQDKFLNFLKSFVAYSSELILIIALYMKIDLSDIKPHRSLFAPDLGSVLFEYQKLFG